MSEQMGIDIPATAQTPRAAYEVTSRFDTGLLTFTLSRTEAQAYLKRNPPTGRWLEPTAQTDVAAHDFAHLGLPEPEKFTTGMRYGYVCPDATAPVGESAEPYGMYGGTSEEDCVRLYAHDYMPGRTRIYLRAHYEPGISPLPAGMSPRAD
ncbi:hypothetical protein [Streptomyces salinarius]|uniref:hypothetical protein n=1 Tax=Streptomyces salinarius TaxID=2762598 RepID=UPI0021BD1B30|nr:hypothetical protein [Streptomyces salinarius]